MRENRIRSIWKAGGAVVNGWLAIPATFSAEVMAHQGWDSLTIDLQHGVVDYQKTVDMFTAISTTNTVPMARVPWNEPGILMKVLDAGAYAVICPMVNTRADAERLVAATHYPPRGTRSFGPIRGLLYGGPDYATHANDTVVVFAMIETREALDNLDDILSVPGLDAIYIGPGDQGIGALGWAVVADTSPKEAAGLSGGLFNTFGNVAGITTPIVIGYILQATGSFAWALVYVGANAAMMIVMYLVVVGEIRRVELKTSVVKTVSATGPQVA